LEKQDQPGGHTLAPEPLLHFQRYDARIEAIDPDQRRPEHAQRLLGREFDRRELKALSEITNSEDANLSLLYEIGDSAGQHYLRVAAPPQKFDPW
jgi:hypothetical protein